MPEETVDVRVTLPVDLWAQVCHHAELDQIPTNDLLIGAIEQFLHHKQINATLADRLEHEYEEWLIDEARTADVDS